MLTKICTKCGRELPATTEFFYAKATGRFGVASYCIDCDKLKKKAFRGENADKVKQQKREEYERHKDKYLERATDYYSENRDKVLDYHRVYYVENRTQINKKARDRRIKCADQIRLYKQDYQRRNKEKISQRERQRRKDNPEKRRAQNAQRRSRERSGRITSDDIREQYRAQRGRCWWCGKSVDNEYHVDHVIPLARGGSNVPRNIVIACPKCNLSKNAKLPQEWNGRLF